MTNLSSQPLADRVRPKHIEEVVGQQHLLAKGKPLHQALESGKLHSMILWGPPGTGKTTLAKLLAQSEGTQFISLSAVLSGVKDIRSAVEHARQINSSSLHATSVVLFVDEVHRFNKAQQDAFLPHIEDGTIVFIGATTENPSFELNNALLSRVRVYVLKKLNRVQLQALLTQTINSLNSADGEHIIEITQEAKSNLATTADGDARRALNTLEVCIDFSEDNVIDNGVLEQVLIETSVRRFDKGGDIFYEMISALHKSIRGSCVDASLYWLCRMLDGGCDPIYIARRLVRIASEDIGNADPRALQLALNAWEVQERLGSPEGELALAQVVIYLSVAAKSNATYMAFKQAMRCAKENGSLDVPLHLRNAPTEFMKALEYGKEYQYAHDYDDGYVPDEQYLPEQLKNQVFYQPVDRGLEIKIKQKLANLRDKDKSKHEE